MSEYGLDGRIDGVLNAELGWKAYSDDDDVYDWRQDNAQGENRYVAALKALDQRDRPYADVIEGYCIFCLGSNDPADSKFWSYRLDGGSAQILTDLVAYSYSLSPQNVMAVVSPESVTVSWEPPELNTANGPQSRPHCLTVPVKSCPGGTPLTGVLKSPRSGKLAVCLVPPQSECQHERPDVGWG